MAVKAVAFVTLLRPDGANVKLNVKVIGLDTPAVDDTVVMPGVSPTVDPATLATDVETYLTTNYSYTFGSGDSVVILPISLAAAHTWTGQHTFNLPVRGPVGDAAAPAFTFIGATDSGTYFAASEIQFGTAGVNRGSIGASGVHIDGPLFTRTDGTAADPVYTFRNNADVGFYRAAAGTLGIATDGTARLSIDHDGAWLLGGTTAGAAGQVLTSAGASAPPTWEAGGGGTAANPTALVGPAPVNGVASTYMRSDAAPAINLADAYSWTGVHTFSPRVGIGISTPNAPLQFASAEANRKISLYDSSNNDHQFYGFGINTSALRYQINGTGAAHIFYAATSASASNEVFRINGTGGFISPAMDQTITGADGAKLWLAKYSGGTGHNNAPTAIGAASTYLYIGGREYGNNGWGGIGFSYVGSPTDHPAVWIGWEERNTSGNTNGDFVVATRSVTTNTAPTERLRVTNLGALAVNGMANTGTTGQVLTSAGAGAPPTWETPTGGGGSGANPTALAGPIAVDGVATTFMRSDAAPAVDQAATYNWTGISSFSVGPMGNYTVTGASPGPTIVNKSYVDAALAGAPFVDGPASSTDGEVALFSGSSGKLLKAGSAKLSISGEMTLASVSIFDYGGPRAPNEAGLLSFSDASHVGISSWTETTGAMEHIEFVNGATPGTIVGTISTNGSATAYNTSSDYRLKEYDIPLANAGAILDELRPVRFRWKSDGSPGVGFFAHELQRYIPEAVTGEKDGPQMQAVDFAKVVPYLVAALQDSRARIHALEDALSAR